LVHIDGFDGYIESLGANSNTVVVVIYGGVKVERIQYKTTPSTFVVSDYFDKWHMVSLVRSGTITITTWSVGNQTHVEMYHIQPLIRIIWLINMDMILS
jgi:hypothetical protein